MPAALLHSASSVQVSVAAAQISPDGANSTSMKSNMPAHRPGPQLPRWIGSLTGCAVVETNSGCAVSALSDVIT